MKEVVLSISPQMRQQLWNHLVPQRMTSEEAAFGFARAEDADNELTLAIVDVRLMQPDDFVYRSRYALELKDEARAGVIKAAHDLSASLVELHSHYGTGEAQFSPSDEAGFEEFVPHIWWRLKHRPFVAVVVAKSGLDALAWVQNAQTPEPLRGIRVGGKMLLPTNLSWQSLQKDHERDERE